MLLSFLPTESWIALAILAAALIGIGGTGEKILSIRYLPDATTLMLWLAAVSYTHLTLPTNREV